MDTISQRELRNGSAEVLRRVEQGERLTITRHGVPVADLVPHAQARSVRRRRFVPVTEIASSAKNLPNWDVERFASELDLLDHMVDDGDADRWLEDP